MSKFSNKSVRLAAFAALVLWPVSPCFAELSKDKILAIAEARVRVLQEYGKVADGVKPSPDLAELRSHRQEFAEKFRIFSMQDRLALSAKADSRCDQLVSALYSLGWDISKSAAVFESQAGDVQVMTKFAAFHRLKFEVEAGLLKMLIAQVLLDRDLGYSPIQNLNLMCEFSDRTKAKAELKGIWRDLQALSMLFIGQQGVADFGRAHLALARKASDYHDDQSTWFIPNAIAAAVVPVGVLGQALKLSLQVLTSAPKAVIYSAGAEKAVLAAVGAVSGYQYAVHLQGRAKLMSHDQLQGTLRLADSVLDSSIEQFADLIEIVVAAQDQMASELIRAKREYLEGYPFIKHYLQKTGSVDGAVQYLKRKMAEL